MGKNGTEINGHILLFEAVREAELLLDYISRQGLKFDRKTAAAIITAKHLFASGTWTPQDETEFWEAYNTAARSIAPVTVASIKAMTDTPTHSLLFKVAKSISMGKLRSSAARWHALQYSLFTLAILAALITVQIYWSSGVNLLAKIEKHKQELETNWTALLSMGGDIKKLKKEGNPEAIKVLAHLRRERASYEADLLVFKKYWQPRWLKQADVQQPADLAFQKGTDSQQEDLINGLASVGVASLGLQMIQSNILPLLYGLLGAAAYVLRTLSLRIKNMTYVPTANTGFGLRIQLGALAGLAIGWFYKPDALVNGSSLSPFALAFLAGYSVELFFTAMDKFVLAFSGSKVKDQKKADKTLPEGEVEVKAA